MIYTVEFGTSREKSRVIGKADTIKCEELGWL